MASIDDVSRLVANISQRVQETNKSDQIASSGKAHKQKGTQLKRTQVPLPEKVRERILQAKIGDKLNRRVAQQFFVEAILINEFGDEMLGDHRFADVVNRVTAALSSNADVSSKLDEWLLESSKSKGFI